MHMRVAVYGIGNNFIRNYRWIADRYEITHLVDGGGAKTGTFFQGMEVHSPEILKVGMYDAILVTPNAHGEIVSNLLSIGVKSEQMIFLNDILPSDDVGKELAVAFLILGGLGDALIALNYIEVFRRKFSGKHIKLFLETVSGRNAYKELILEYGLFTEICDISENKMCPEKYHLYIAVRRYPEILYADRMRISRLCPEMIDYIQLLEKYRIFHPRYFEKDFVADGVSAAHESICGRKRYEQPDVYGYLGLHAHYDFELKTDIHALERFGITEDGYITVHRGTEARNYTEGSTKLWTVDGYNAIFQYLSTEYPEYCVVLVGAGYEKNESLAFTGINLIGKTSLPELAVIVGKAKLHIDTEGGLVHLRHAVSGKTSVVLFGPTSDEFFGYDENENIRSSACPYPCEWMKEGWSRECIREDKKRICMESIRVDMVQAAIKRALEG